jgi:hypothetical protein
LGVGLQCPKEEQGKKDGYWLLNFVQQMTWCRKFWHKFFSFTPFSKAFITPSLQSDLGEEVYNFCNIGNFPQKSKPATFSFALLKISLSSPFFLRYLLPPQSQKFSRLA